MANSAETQCLHKATEKVEQPLRALRPNQDLITVLFSSPTVLSRLVSIFRRLREQYLGETPCLPAERLVLDQRGRCAEHSGRLRAPLYAKGEAMEELILDLVHGLVSVKMQSLVLSRYCWPRSSDRCRQRAIGWSRWGKTIF